MNKKQSHELHYVDDYNQLITYSKPSLSPHIWTKG